MKQKIDREKETVQLMICLYCKHIEKNAQLCESCKQLIEYAHKRLDGCRFGENKPACNHCDVHCYKPEMRTDKASHAQNRAADDMVCPESGFIAFVGPLILLIVN